jgi:hypothetical protein
MLSAEIADIKRGVWTPAFSEAKLQKMRKGIEFGCRDITIGIKVK